MREGWQFIALGDACDVIGGGTPSKRNPAFYEGDIPWATVRDMRNEVLSKTEFHISQEAVNSSSTKIIPGRNVIIATRVGLGKVCLLQKDTAINQDLRGVIPKSKNIDVRFLFRWFQSIANKIEGEGTGATVKGVKLPFIKSLQLPLPPLPEQKRIVAILDEAFAGIDTAIANTEKNLANARELFESYLNHRLLDIAFQEPIQTLSCITRLIVDCEHKTAPTQETGFPSIRTPNIGKGDLILDDVKRVSAETFSQWTRRAEPEPGDLILAREAPAGNVGVIPEGERVCLGQRTVLIRPDNEFVHSKYLAYLILHPVIQERLLSRSTGATVQHVNMRDIRALAIGSLPPIGEQLKDVDVLESVQSMGAQLVAIYQQKLTALAELKQSLLQKAFSGELTADSVDEVETLEAELA